MTPEEKKLIKARKLVAAVNRLAKKQGLNFFIVTDGASGISNNGNPAVRNAREAQIKWELEHGADPYEDWSKKAQAYDRKKWPDYEKYQKKHHDEIVAKVERLIREHFAKMRPWAIKTKDGKFIQKKDLTEDDIKDAIVRTGKAALRARRGVCHDLANARYKMLKDKGIDVSRLFVDWEDAHANDGLLGHSMVFFRGADGKYHYGNPHMAEKSRNAFGEFDDLTDAVRQYIATIKSDGGLNDEEPFTVYDTSDVNYPEIVPYTEYADLSRKGKRIMEQGHEKKAQAITQEEIEALARPHYPDSGSHGWNHILDVVESAKRMRRKKLLKKELAALMYHDSSLLTGPRDTHAEDSAEIARKELAGRFSRRQIEDIVNAIAHHRASYEGKRKSRLENLVAAADRDVFVDGNIDDYILRSYRYGIEHGMTPEEAVDNTLHHMPDKYGTNGYAYVNVPKIYMDTYGNEVIKAQKAFDSMTADRIRELAKKAE